MTEERDNIVVLEDESGVEVEFGHLDTVQMNEMEYVVLLPVEQLGEEEGQVVILKVEQDESGEDVLAGVEDESELEQVFEEFKMRMEDEFEFLDDEE